MNSETAKHQGIVAQGRKILNFEVRLCYIIAEELDNPGTIIMGCRVWWTVFFFPLSFFLVFFFFFFEINGWPGTSYVGPGWS